MGFLVAGQGTFLWLVVINDGTKAGLNDKSYHKDSVRYSKEAEEGGL